MQFSNVLSEFFTDTLSFYRMEIYYDFESFLLCFNFVFFTHHFSRNTNNENELGVFPPWTILNNSFLKLLFGLAPWTIAAELFSIVSVVTFSFIITRILGK